MRQFAHTEKLLFTRKLTSFIMVLCLVLMAGCKTVDEPSYSVDIAILVQNLKQQADAHVLVKGYVEQFFFSVQGRLLMINAGRVGIYEYSNAQTAALEASRISSDGKTVSISPDGEPVKTELHYFGFPHFFLKDNMIGFYLGESEAVLGPLELTMGKQLAGR